MVSAETRLNRIEKIIGQPLEGGQLTFEERLRRLEALLGSLNTTLGNVSKGSIGGWLADNQSLYTLSDGIRVVDMRSADKHILIRDLQGALGGILVFQDAFTDSDGTVLTTGHTPDTGSVWESWGGGSNFIINSNKVGCPSPFPTRRIKNNIGIADDYQVQFDLYLPTEGLIGTTQSMTVYLRGFDDVYGLLDTSQDGLRVEFIPKDLSWEIQIRHLVSGLWIQDSGVASGTVSWNYGDHNSFKISLLNNVVKVYETISGTSTLLVTSNALEEGLASVYCGMSCNNADQDDGWNIDNFIVRKLSGYRAELGKVGTSDTEYGLRLWDQDGNLFLNEEGIVLSATDVWSNPSSGVYQVDSGHFTVLTDVTIATSVTLTVVGTLVILSGA